jgi:putative iron-regulated protein
MKKISYLFAFFAFIFLSNCDKNEPIAPAKNYDSIIQNIANDVILANYQALFEKTNQLFDALTILEQTQNQGNLNAARQAWRDSRVPWEQSEGFLFGPVDQQGIDPSIDSWPVNQTDLDAVLGSSAVLTKNYVDGLDGTLKGYHTLEYLLFGGENDKLIGDFTPRQFEYLRACGESLKGATTQLYFAWKPDQQNFVKNLLTAGAAGNQIYPSQKAVLQEIINGLVAIADEVANGKINDPFSQQNLTLEESRFSANSKQDFADNLRSVKNAYTGIYKNSTGFGLSSLIFEQNATLDAKIRTQIDEAILAIESIPGTFTTAIFEAPQAVLNAQQKVRTVQATLENEILPIISNL